MPQNSLAGDVVVSGLEKELLIQPFIPGAKLWTYANVIEPVNLDESVPPNVNSPFTEERLVVGSKDTDTSRAEIVPM